MKLVSIIRKGTVLAMLVVVTACTTAPPPPPPPPKVVEIPRRPYPPMGASPTLTVPPLGPDGTRKTINTAVGPMQAAWNLRSAYNVAALNCRDPQYEPIIVSYSQFLKTHSKALASINTALDREFRAQHGNSGNRVRDSYQTQVYNYFALPPVLPVFCEATMQLAQEMAAVRPEDYPTYAPTGLAKLEAIYLDFFERFEQYRRDVAAWDAQYSPQQPVIAAETLSPISVE